MREAFEAPEILAQLSGLLARDHREYKWLFGMAAPVMKNLIRWRELGISHEEILRKIR